MTHERQPPHEMSDEDLMAAAEHAKEDYDASRSSHEEHRGRLRECVIAMNSRMGYRKISMALDIPLDTVRQMVKGPRG